MSDCPAECLDHCGRFRTVATDSYHIHNRDEKARFDCASIKGYNRPKLSPPQWGTADSEIKVSSVKNPELKKKKILVKPGVGCLLSRIVFLLFSTFPVHSPSFFCAKPGCCFSMLAVVNAGSCVGPQNTVGHLFIVTDD